MAHPPALQFKFAVRAPADQVYRAFTSSTALREWFSDIASTEPRPGGRAFFAWNAGYYSAGQFRRLLPGKSVAFTWLGPGEPASTLVKVQIAPRITTTAVTVTHTGFGRGAAWAKHIPAIQHGWEQALENLAAVLERGEDLRMTLRPIVGLSGLDNLTPEMAARLGVPVTAGVRIDSTVAGLGAEAAGLRPDDVIVSLDGRKVSGYSSLVAALQPHRAGDTIKAAFYRGVEKHSVALTLSKRPLPEVPAAPEVLAEALQAMYAQTDRELDRALKGVTEAEASFRPGPDQWSARDVLAHLIHGARGGHEFIGEMIDGRERWYDDYAVTVRARLEATQAALPRRRDLLAEFRRGEVETVALVRNLPAEFVARKSAYSRVGYNLLGDSEHTRIHVVQIRAAIEAARQAAAEEK